MKRVCIIFRAIWTRYSNFSYRFHRNPFGRQPVGVVESRWPLLRSGNRSRTSGRRIFLFPHSLSLFEEYFPYRLKFVSAFSGPCIEERQNDSTLLWWRLRHNELDSAGRVNGKKMDKKKWMVKKIAELILNIPQTWTCLHIHLYFQAVHRRRMFWA